MLTPVLLEGCRPDLTFPQALRLRVGDRFVFLPSVERAIAWLQAPGNDATRDRLEEPLELLLAAQDSGSRVDVAVAYRALAAGVVRERLVFR